MLRLLVLLLVLPPAIVGQTYDIVIQNGRVIDPDSGLDEVRNVAIQGDKIAAVTSRPVTGRKTLDARGHVVAPGFIDLHQHGQSPTNYRAQVHDGVTTALELEIGVENVSAWYDERTARTPVNYGASISHPYSRQIAMTGSNPGLEGEALTEEINPQQFEKLKAQIRQGLEQGAAAVGFGIAYTPGATQSELNELFQLAAEFNASCHVHMRTSRTDFTNLDEVLEAAGVSGASLHIVHINSSGRDRAPQYLDRIRQAQLDGIDVTTECYPYNRGSTLIQSHLFDDWESYPESEFSQFIWVETGEALTRETFGKYRKTGGTLIQPASYKEETVETLVGHPMTIIASDGMWIDNGRAHPRTWGTFSRVLGRYVREMQALTIHEALAKMTIRPARRLEARIPAMRQKGRIRSGADADIVVFDPETVIDVATFSDPARNSKGFRHVLVNGVVTLEDGNFVENAAGGRPIRAEVTR